MRRVRLHLLIEKMPAGILRGLILATLGPTAPWASSCAGATSEAFFVELTKSEFDASKSILADSNAVKKPLCRKAKRATLSARNYIFRQMPIRADLAYLSGKQISRGIGRSTGTPVAQNNSGQILSIDVVAIAALGPLASLLYFGRSQT
jgi:hypothetical protein